MSPGKPKIISVFLMPLVALLAVAVDIGLIIVSVVVFGGDVGIGAQLLINLGAIFIAISCYYLLNKYLLHNTLESLLDGERVPSLWQFVFWVSMSVVIIATVILVYFAVGGVTVTTLGSSIALGLAATFVASLFPGVIEELSYRYFMYGYFRTVVPKIWAVLISGLIFGSLHLNQVTSTIAGIQILVAAICVSFLFTAIYEATGSIWTSAVFHVIWDMATERDGLHLTNLLNIGDEVRYGQLEVTIQADNIFLSGGEFGVETAIPTMLVYVCTAVLIWRFRSKLAIKGTSGLGVL